MGKVTIGAVVFIVGLLVAYNMVGNNLDVRAYKNIQEVNALYEVYYGE